MPRIGEANAVSDQFELLADWWYCCDELCQCSYPRIRRLTLPKTVSPDGTWTRWASGEELEKGPWLSQPDAAERREQWEWMLAAARRHGVGNLAEIEQEAKEYLT